MKTHGKKIQQKISFTEVKVDNKSIKIVWLELIFDISFFTWEDECEQWIIFIIIHSIEKKIESDDELGSEVGATMDDKIFY